MTRMIHCRYLKRQAEGLAKPPYPGPLGQRIYEQISQEAWDAWTAHQTMLINEYRLSLMEPEARKFLTTEMEKFLFGEGADLPEGYVPPTQ